MTGLEKVGPDFFNDRAEKGWSRFFPDCAKSKTPKNFSPAARYLEHPFERPRDAHESD